MRRNILLPLLAIAGGIAGAVLRLQQWTTAYDPATMTFHETNPYLLPLFLLTLGCVLALFLHGGKTTPATASEAYRCPASGHMTLKTISAFLQLVAGALCLLDGYQKLQLWQLDPGSMMIAYPGSLLLCGGMCCFSCFVTLKLAKGSSKGKMTRSDAILSMLPAIAALLWMFSIHLDHSTDPILNSYVYPLLCAAFLMLSQYYVAGYFQGRCFPRRAAFCCLMGVALGLVSLMDYACAILGLSGGGFTLPSWNTLFQITLTIGLCLSALADSYALIRSVFGPPWPRRLGNAAPARSEPRSDS